MVKKPHRRIWNKRSGKMMPPKTLMAQEGHKGEVKHVFPGDKATFLSKLQHQIRKNIS